MFKSGKIARLRHTPRILISSLEFLLPQIHWKGVNSILRNTNTRIGQQRSCKPAFDEGNYREISLTPSRFKPGEGLRDCDIFETSDNLSLNL